MVGRGERGTCCKLSALLSSLRVRQPDDDRRRIRPEGRGREEGRVENSERDEFLVSRRYYSVLLYPLTSSSYPATKED